MAQASLQDFIKQSLDEICSAVDEARKRHSYIAPKHLGATAINHALATKVNFDIAVSVTDTAGELSSSSSNVGGGFKISVFRASADMSANDTDSASQSRSHESRISFSVPIYFQYDEEEDRKEETRIRNTKF